MPLTVVPELSDGDRNPVCAGSSSSLIDQIVREGARRMLAAALQAEVDAYIAAFAEEREEADRRLVVRNGSHAAREILSGAGAIEVKAPRVNDKRIDESTGGGIPSGVGSDLAGKQVIGGQGPLLRGRVMSVIEGVGGQMSTTLGEARPTVRDVAGEQQERRPIRELIDDRLLDELLARSRDEAGGLRLTGEGSMLGDLVKAVLERALEAELTAHLGYTRHVQGAGAAAGTPVTERSARRCRPGSGRSGWQSRGTGPEASNRCWCPSGRAGSPAAWMTWSSRCTRTA